MPPPHHRRPAVSTLFPDPVSFHVGLPLDASGEAGACLMTQPPKIKNVDHLFIQLVRRYGPIANTIAAFDLLLRDIIPKRIMGSSDVVNEVNSAYLLSNVRIIKPMLEGRNGVERPLFPAEARKLGLTYAATIYADITHTKYAGADAGASVFSRNYIVGKLPVMLGCGACHLCGYTPAERRAVGEDGSPLDVGYFIIDGSERTIETNETLGTNQIFANVDNRTGIHECRVTTPSATGTTVTSTSLGRGWPVVNVTIREKGLMHTATASNPFFCVMDALHQLLYPDLFGYDATLYPDRNIPPDRRDELREEILRRSIAMVKTFVWPGHDAEVDAFFVASRLKYGMIEWPIKEIITKRLEATTFSAMSLNAMLATARRAAASAITTAAGKNDGVVTETAIEDAARAAAEATQEIATAANSDRARTLLVFIFKDVFSNTNPEDFEQKMMLLARLGAHQMMLSTGIRPADNRDSWANKRMKLPGDTFRQTTNAFRITATAAGIVRSSGISVDRIFSSTRIIQAASGKENTVQPIIRVTPIAVPSQIASVMTPTSKKSRNLAIRGVRPSQLGYCCPSDTPCSDTIGLRKVLAITCWIGLPRSFDTAKVIIDSVVAPLAKNRAPATDIPVLLDGVILGFTNDGRIACDAVRRGLKRNLEFFDISAKYDPDERIVDIHVSGGRPSRPLLVIDEDAPPGGDAIIANRFPYGTSVESLIVAGAIEFVSAPEQEFARVVQEPDRVDEAIAERAALPRDKRCYPFFSEVNPSAILGMPASTVPHASATQGARVTYQATMERQGLGRYSDVFHTRTTDQAYKCVDGTTPLVRSITYGPLGLERSPAGRQLLVLFKSVPGNVEDGIVANLESFNNIHITKIHTKKAVARGATTINTNASSAPIATNVGGLPAASMIEVFGKPARNTSSTPLYHAIEDNGFPRIGAVIAKGDCIIAMRRIFRDANGAEILVKDVGEFASIVDEGVVSRIETFERGDSIYAYIQIRQIRGVVAGDKLAARCSQKGTIRDFVSNYSGTSPGFSSDETTNERRRLASAVGVDALRDVLSAEAATQASIQRSERELRGDPFRYALSIPTVASGPDRGAVPDLIINPACLPSRMTICLLHEAHGASAAAHTGIIEDGTPFSHYIRDRHEHNRAVLAGAGVDPGGFHVMQMPGGRRMNPTARMFMCPIYYIFLRHNVLDKIQARDSGAVYPIWQQPVKGRSRNGGLREGDMERSAMASSGAAELMRSVMIYNSDAHTRELCVTCGHPAIVNYHLGIMRCSICPPGKEKISLQRIPFIKVIINQYIAGCCIFSLARDLRAITAPIDPI